jgi:stage II sporulation protein M
MPILALTVNGWLLAVVGAEIVRAESLGFLLAGILPHGILEIPALIIAQAAAMSFGATVVAAVFKKERRSQIPPSFKQNLRWLGLALFLLLPAAIIETFVTPLLLD